MACARRCLLPYTPAALPLPHPPPPLPPSPRASLIIEVRGPSRDLHSGNEGGVFTEPLAELSKVLASLVDSRAAIMVPGEGPASLACFLWRSRAGVCL